MTRIASIASAALAAALAILLAGAALAQSASVDFVNNSGATVWRLYMSSTNTNSWETDLLGNSVLYPGQSLSVTRANMSGCLYDVLIEWEGGYQETGVFDLCTYGRYVIN